MQWDITDTVISIHALLAESDGVTLHDRIKHLFISIHALLAESDVGGAREEFAQKIFLSTLSLRRATNTSKKERMLTDISIHALLAESDPRHQRQHQHRKISIHALLAESDCSRLSQPSRPPAFLSTLSLRRATGFGLARLAPGAYFYPRSPCGERR